MKIGILTFHTPINYGAVLQAYALQKFLKLTYPNSSIYVIDFKTNEHIRKYGIFIPFRRNLLLYFFNQLCVVLRFPSLFRRKIRFKTFIKQEFDLTERYFTQEELLSNVPAMDAYIVGSDQVFHPKSKYLQAYYLDFKSHDSKKIAYAPSFGMSEFSEEIKKIITPFLKDFHALSCREKDGAMFIQAIIGKEVQTVLDPVFLLNKSQWSKISIEPKTTEKYIFIYDLNGHEHLINIASKIRKVTGYKIFCQTQTAHKFYDIDNQFYDSGPREFLGLLKNAEYIVTDSFHGTAFSILFDKPQYIYIAMPQAASRIYSLISQFGLEKSIIENGMSHKFIFRKEDIAIDNYRKIEELKARSIHFLEDALKS